MIITEKKMKIAIAQGFGFPERWKMYCEQKMIVFKMVDPYALDIIEQVADCNAFMWHFFHSNEKDYLCAKPILHALELAGKKVFPDHRTMWHFDDKVGQNYLMEALQFPVVPTYIFYEKKKAMTWADTAAFPKVFKLRGGAGSKNVKLVKTKAQAKRLIRKAFSSGFAQYDKFESLKERWRRYRLGLAPFVEVLKGIGRLFHTTAYARTVGKEKGYIYFQDFIANNNFDIRIIIIGNKAFGIKRLVRNKDFRASGSGNIVYEKSQINEDCIKLAFDLNLKLKSQCVAYDFIFDKEKKPLIVEMSYGFNKAGYDFCEGYWDKHLNWYEGPFNPYGWMIENLIGEEDGGNTRR